MPCFRQKSEIVSPFARSRSASRSNRATLSAFLRLLMGPSRVYFTRGLPFRLDQFLGSRPVRNSCRESRAKQGCCSLTSREGWFGRKFSKLVHLGIKSSAYLFRLLTGRHPSLK